MSALHPDFLRAVVLVSSFRGDDHNRICAALLLIGCKLATFDAGMVPAELCGHSKTALGIATGSLLAQGLLEVCGRVRSSSPAANGRKVNQIRIPEGKLGAVQTWLSRHGYKDAETAQMELVH